VAFGSDCVYRYLSHQSDRLGEEPGEHRQTDQHYRHHVVGRCSTRIGRHVDVPSVQADFAEAHRCQKTDIDRCRQETDVYRLGSEVGFVEGFEAADQPSSWP
jgi:hypothetical protein